jgi:hypothetical protein
MFSVFTWEELWYTGLHPQFKPTTRSVSRNRDGATIRNARGGDCVIEICRSIPKVYKNNTIYIYIIKIDLK